MNIHETTCIKLSYFILIIIAFVVLILSIFLLGIMIKKIYEIRKKNKKIHHLPTLDK